ncbi:MAG TPA: hypothetical protein VG940_01670 [Gemmatimonadales bacterium]|nr:hypothetical protein [Gemmatimonadales bacterium]
MRAFRHPALALLLLVLPNAGLAAQGDPRLARLSPAARVEIARLVDSLIRRGVPAEPLIDKALEGQTKGAPDARIVAAVRAWGIDLGRARAGLGARADEATLVAGASVLRAGVAPDLLAALAAARPDGDLLVPLTAITEMTAAGMPADSAASQIVSLTQHGGSDDQVRETQRRASQGRGQGQGQGPPAAGNRGQGRGQGQPPRTVPNKKGKIPGQGNGNGHGNGSGNGNGNGNGNGHPAQLP